MTSVHAECRCPSWNTPGEPELQAVVNHLIWVLETELIDPLDKQYGLLTTKGSFQPP